MSSLFVALQQQIVARLEADPFFEGISVLYEEKADFEFSINEAIAKLGMAVVVKLFGGQCGQKPGPYFDKIDITVAVAENVTLNSTGKSALEVAENVMTLLHLWTPDAQSELIKCAPQAFDNQAASDSLNLVTCNFITSFGLQNAIPQVATPTISPSSGAVSQTVTLACATAGASIFYTTNGKTPTPRQGTLYTAPITISSACTLRVRAWLAGYNNSDESTGTYTTP